MRIQLSEAQDEVRPDHGVGMTLPALIGNPSAQNPKVDAILADDSSFAALSAFATWHIASKPSTWRPGVLRWLA